MSLVLWFFSHAFVAFFLPTACFCLEFFSANKCLLFNSGRDISLLCLLAEIKCQVKMRAFFIWGLKEVTYLFLDENLGPAKKIRTYIFRNSVTWEKKLYYFIAIIFYCICDLSRFFTPCNGYIYRYVLPGIGQNLANIVINLHITQRHRRWGWLSLTDLPMIGTRLCCEVASFCKHRETAVIVSLSLQIVQRLS